MSLDEKLKRWRDATESLEPSVKLLAALEATLDTPPPPSGRAVKWVLVTAVVGAVVAGVLGAQRLGWNWFSTEPASTSAAVGVPDASVAAEARACGPAPGAIAISTTTFSPQEERARAGEARRLVSTRPLSCLAQRQPLLQLLGARSTNEAERLRLISRLAFLCGAPSVPAWATTSDDAPCDHADWCHVPSCDLASEACALSWAARPAGTCAHRAGTRAALDFACVRFLRAQGTEAQVRARADDAWCLRPEALEERKYLHQHDAGMELP